MAATASGQGYWLLAADGGIFPFGDALGYGSPVASINVSTNPAVAIVSVPQPPPLVLWPVLSAKGGLSLTLGDANGTAVLPFRVPQIQVYSSTDATLPVSNWLPLTNSLVLTNGVLRIDGLTPFGSSGRFFRAVERP
jgi:hypothetical protein